MSEGYTVKAWYESGAFEQVTHPRPEIASSIFDDAAVNPHVEAVELHGPDGALLDRIQDGTPPDPCPQLTPVDTLG